MRGTNAWKRIPEAHAKEGLISLKVKHGQATTPTTEANAASITVPAWAAAGMLRLLMLEGVPFVNGQPNPSVEQLRQLKDKIRMADGVLE